MSMQTIDQITVRANPDAIFRLAADIEDWPRFLPHYRWVRVIEQRSEGRVVEMAARRGVMPVKWTSLQWLDPSARRVYYRHVGGATRGMRVEWKIEPRGGITRVLLVHDLTLDVPLVRSMPGRVIVDRFFIKYIAGRTLECIKREAEN